MPFVPLMLYHCPHCDAECRVSQMSGPDAFKGPEQGNFAKCGGCGSLLVATTDDFRIGTRRDVERLTPEQRQEIENVMGEIVFAPGA